jgi:hypothetical protein
VGGIDNKDLPKAAKMLDTEIQAFVESIIRGFALRISWIGKLLNCMSSYKKGWDLHEQSFTGQWKVFFLVSRQ